MSQAALDSLDRSAAGLRTAMEAGDADKIGRALEAFAGALDAVRAVGAWRADPKAREQMKVLRARLESDHMLARLLGDLAGRERELIAQSTRGSVAMTYGR